MLKVVDFSLIFASKEVSAHHSVCMTNLNVCLIGQRAFIGKCCMDRDCPDDYIESTEQSIASTQQFLAHFDHLQPDKSPDSTTPKINGKIDTSASPPLVRPILTPRFALSCTPNLLNSLSEISRSYTPTLAIQTHLSENPAECTRALELFPECTTYAGVYEKYGLLNEGTILAHCVHLSEEERGLIKRCGAGISHCPGSNLHLNSGAARVREMLDVGIKVSRHKRVA
jgi:guanine deaminase